MEDQFGRVHGDQAVGVFDGQPETLDSNQYPLWKPQESQSRTAADGENQVRLQDGGWIQFLEKNSCDSFQITSTDVF